MGDVIQATFGRKLDDGGRARFLARRALKRAELEAILAKGLAIAESIKAMRPDDLAMDHADPGMPSDSAYHAPAPDLA